MRILSLTFEKKDRTLFASTNRGTVLRYARDMSISNSSDPVYDLQSINVIIIHNNYIFGREITGKLVQWHKVTLVVLKIVDLNNWLDDGIARVPNACHGLAIWRNKLYVSMPSGQVGRFDPMTLKFEWISDYQTASNIECFDFTDDDFHVATEFTGKLYAGHIDLEMKAVGQLSKAVIHRIVYDKIHSRYWATDDYFCGITIFDKKSLDEPLRLKLTHDDVEYIDLSHDHQLALVSCFDRYVYVLENRETPQLKTRLGPFDYQVIQTLWRDENSCFVLTESGALYVVEVRKNEIVRHVEPQNCIWDLQPCVQNPFELWASCESGTLKKLKIESRHLALIYETQLALGPLRRLIPFSATQVYVLSMSGIVALFDVETGLVWQHQAAPLLRDFTLAQNQLFICGENGDLVCLNGSDGQVVWTKTFDLPLFSISAHPSENQLIVSEKLVADKDTFACDNRLLVVRCENGEVIRSTVLRGNVKSITWINDFKFLVSGNGNVHAKLIDWPSLSELQLWDKFQVNTAERIKPLGDFVHTTTYGYQLNSYSFDGSIVDAAFPFEDYATALIAVGKDTLVAGGRGGFLSSFKVCGGIPQLISSLRFTQ